MHAGGIEFLPPALTPRIRAGLAAVALALFGSAAVAETASAKPVFGVVPQDGALPDTADLDLMRPAGIGGLRTMLPWGLVEQKQGEYDWSQTDVVIRETTNRGIQPLVFLYGTPDWAAATDNRDCAGGACAVFPPKSAATRSAFAAFAAAAASRYGPGGSFWETPVNPAAAVTIPGSTAVADPEPDPLPRAGPPCGCTTPSPIRVWQIWNEQNSPKYFAPKVDIPRYAALLKSAADGIRSVDPDAEIVLGGMWGPYSAREVVTPTNTYLERLYELGAEKSFDSIAIHPYANNADASVAQLQSARRVVTDAGDSRAGLWVTEIGWAGRGPPQSPYVKGLVGQARILSRALGEFKRKARSFNLRGVFWYSWRDKKGGDAICDWCGHAGLRTKSGGEKPAWRAFVRVARS